MLCSSEAASVDLCVNVGYKLTFRSGIKLHVQASEFFKIHVSEQLFNNQVIISLLEEFKLWLVWSWHKLTTHVFMEQE